MDIIHQLEAMRKRIIQEVNTEFDVLIEQAAKEQHMEDRKEYAKPYEVKYPLTAGAAVFKGKKPTSVIIGEKPPIRVRTWKQLVDEIVQDCISEPKYKRALEGLCGKVSGKKRVLLAESPKEMRSPLAISDTLYMETHYDTETLLNILTTRILGPIGYDFSEIVVTIRNV